MAVYKDKKNKTWFCKIYINGKSTTRRGFKTKKEAVEQEKKLLKIANTKDNLKATQINYVDKTTKITINEIANEYIKQLEYNHSSSSYTADSLYRLHIAKSFGKKEVDSIKMSDIKKLQTDMLNKKYNGKYYTYKSINHVTGLFKSLMNYAVKFEYIEKNPIQNFTNLKIEKDISKENFWTDEEFKKAIQYEKDFKWYCFLLLAYLTGMRKGEIRGLQWNDVDFNAKMITIKRHINDKVLKNSRKSIEDQKVLKGRKNSDMHKIAMDLTTISILKKWYEIERSSNDFQNTWYVFGRNHYIGQNSPKRHLDKISEMANLKRITFHGLRHSHVSFLIHQGLNPYEIAERIGDTVEMVLNVYGHMFPNPQTKVIEALNHGFNIELNNNNK